LRRSQQPGRLAGKAAPVESINLKVLIVRAASRFPNCRFLSQEGAMHIHGNSMNLNEASLYSASAVEKAASAQRAAETRKKLLMKAQEIDGSPTPDETVMISHWLNPQQGPFQTPGPPK
jgi:hypothetical protein